MLSGTWRLIWMGVMFLVLVPALGYGWGYRGWGPPYPSYIQRRRSRPGVIAVGLVPFDHKAWGRGGDLIWIVASVGIILAATSFLWRGGP
jgi:hypothetical protein